MTRLTRGDRVVVASHNPGKLREIEALLTPFGIETVGAAALGLAEPEETGETFAANAALKAEAAARSSALPALADDSGLEVAALGRAPGIYSARWAGPDKDFGLAMRRVEDELSRLRTQGSSWPGSSRPSTPVAPAARTAVDARDKPGHDKSGGDACIANFVCVLALAQPGAETRLFEGKVFGRLTFPPRGSKGFGYDPIFIPDGGTLTFGEMEPDAKHAISHRARAFALFRDACLGDR